MKRLLLLLLALPLTTFAAEGGVKLDHAPVNINDHASLQRGARIFLNYCVTCHSAGYMRYTHLTDIGLTQDQVKKNLMFASDKLGATMTVAMRPEDAKAWFGAPPPDLTVETRSRGPDWVYTYLRTFYRDPSRPSGWNNLVFDKVAMPAVLHGLQGEMVPVYRSVMGEDGKMQQEVDHLALAKPGKLTLTEYDSMVGDLVNYMTWMGEPTKSERMTVGVGVMLFLFVFFIVAFYLKKEFWKDVH